MLRLLIFALFLTSCATKSGKSPQKSKKEINYTLNILEKQTEDVNFNSKEFGLDFKMFGLKIKLESYIKYK